MEYVDNESTVSVCFWICVLVCFKSIVLTPLSLPTPTAGEASHLLANFKRICETYFPHTELAQIIARQHAGTPQAQHRICVVNAAQWVHVCYCLCVLTLN